MSEAKKEYEYFKGTVLGRYGVNNDKAFDSCDDYIEELKCLLDKKEKKCKRLEEQLNLKCSECNRPKKIKKL